MKSDIETIERIKKHIAKINEVYDERFEPARMSFRLIDDDICLFLANGNYEVNVFVGKPYDADILLSFHRYCVSALEHLF